MGTALITGASRGLGEALAVALFKEGYKLALCAHRDKALFDVARKVQEFKVFQGGDALSVDGVNTASLRVYTELVDVKSARELKTFVRHLGVIVGEPDVLVNNAGYMHEPKPLLELRQWDLEQCLRTNVYAPWILTHLVLPGMLERKKGCIINVASKAAISPGPDVSAYAISKAALHALTMATARECRDTNIRVVTVSPAGMNTQMRAAVYGSEDAEKQMDPGFVANVITDIIEDRRGGDSKVWRVPSGANVLVWKEEVKVFPMPELV